MCEGDSTELVIVPNEYLDPNVLKLSCSFVFGEKIVVENHWSSV